MTGLDSTGARPRKEIQDSAQMLLDVEGLSIEFATPDGWLEVVNDATFSIERRRVTAVVGESGSGKSVTALAIAGLLPPGISRVTGSLRYEGTRLDQMSRRERRALRGTAVGMVFQDPLSSLNPSFTVGDQVAESMRYHLGLSRQAARRRAVDRLREVGIPHAERRIDSYPHEFSGGMRQRVMIAIALACDPHLIIADEPTTALDITVQAEILRLLRHLCEERRAGIMLVTHDFGVVAEIADDVAVMYAGQVVERGPAADVFESPRHPYSEALLRSVASLHGTAGDMLWIPGSPPSPTTVPQGCRFAIRCSYSIEDCAAPQKLLPTDTETAARCVRTSSLELNGVL